MRNNPRQLQQPQEDQLNKSIEDVRGLMHQMQDAPNAEAVLAQALENNPNTAFIANALKGNNLEGIAKNMAKVKGYDINDVIKKLLS